VGVDVKRTKKKSSRDIFLINTTKGFHSFQVTFVQPLAEKALLNGNLIKKESKHFRIRSERRENGKRVQKLII
jgi:hypothetical protein